MLTKGGVIPHRKKVNYARSGKRRYFVQRCSHSVATSLKNKVAPIRSRPHFFLMRVSLVVLEMLTIS